MRVLFLGDIFGRPGRKTVADVLPEVIAAENPDIVLGNVENLAGGKGVNMKTLQEIRKSGVEVFTGGNHSFENIEGNEVYLDPKFPILRPANFPKGTPGKGWNIFPTKNGERLLVISLLGRTFMPQHMDSPFESLDEIFSEVKPSDYDASFIDFHAEATSEKQAVLWYMNGKVSAVVGTHTHIPTADADISDLGTAFQADAGMNGSLDSCIGLKAESVIRKLKTQMPLKFEVEDQGRMQFNAVLIDIVQGRAQSIRHIRKVLS
jgi:metallophosphoesterase (TIGR00282 family)